MPFLKRPQSYECKMRTFIKLEEGMGVGWIKEGNIGLLMSPKRVV